MRTVRSAPRVKVTVKKPAQPKNGDGCVDSRIVGLKAEQIKVLPTKI